MCYDKLCMVNQTPWKENEFTRVSTDKLGLNLGDPHQFVQRYVFLPFNPATHKMAREAQFKMFLCVCLGFLNVTRPALNDRHNERIWESNKITSIYIHMYVWERDPVSPNSTPAPLSGKACSLAAVLEFPRATPAFHQPYNAGRHCTKVGGDFWVRRKTPI